MAEFTKEQVMELILKMKKLNQQKYAEMVYRRESERRPDWDLLGSFLALKASK